MVFLERRADAANDWFEPMLTFFCKAANVGFSDLGRESWTAPSGFKIN